MVQRKYTLNEVDKPGYFARKFLVYFDFIVFIIFVSFSVFPVVLLDILVFSNSGMAPVLAIIFILIGYLVYYSIIPCYIMDGQTILMNLLGVKVISLDNDGNIQSIQENMNFLKSLGFILYYIFFINRPVMSGNQQPRGRWRLIRDQRKVEAQFSNEVEVFDHVVASPILDLEVRLDTLSKRLADSPDKSNLMASKQELVFKTKQLNLNHPETQKWVEWFISQTEKHEQGTIEDHSYLNMIQSYQKFLSDLSV